MASKVDESTPAIPDPRDLSYVSKPCGDLFGAQPTTPAEWKRFELSEEQVKHFQEHGVLSGIPVLDHAACDRLLADLASFTDPAHPHPAHDLFYEFHHNETGDPDAVLLHALGHWRITKLFHDLVFLPGIAVPASQLLGGAVRFWHDQVFAKPPHHGAVVAWHQDYSYWSRSKPMNHLTVHIALDDQTLENGTLHHIYGSHRWHRDGMPLPITSRHFDDMESIKSILTPEELAAFKPVPTMLRKGEAVFHHALSVHGSFSNKSDRPRRAAVVNYFADGTYSDTDDALLAGVPPVPKGTPLTGRFFPIVYDPVWAQVE